MPAPGAGGVQASLVGTVQGMMASARAAFRRKPGPARGAPIESPRRDRHRRRRDDRLFIRIIFLLSHA